MDVKRDQLPLPLPLDDRQVWFLSDLFETGYTVCSAGTERFEALELLRERDLVRAHFCPRVAGGVWQYQLTPDGEEVARVVVATAAA